MPLGNKYTDGNGAYRYGYQGQFAEADAETQLNSFELRMYDPAIGRWLSVDPKRIGDTPYNGMGNNPITNTDPDGGGPDQGVTKDGEVVYDNGINNGNVYLVNDGYNEKITSLDQLKSNSTQVVGNWVWLKNPDVSLVDFVMAQTKFAYPGMDFGVKENWSLVPMDANSSGGFAAAGAVTWGYSNGKGVVELADGPRGIDILYSPESKNLMLGNIYNMRSMLSHEGYHFYQRSLLGPAGVKYFSTDVNARNWVEKNAVNYQRGNRWWGKVNFQSKTWPELKQTKNQWADTY